MLKDHSMFKKKSDNSRDTEQAFSNYESLKDQGLFLPLECQVSSEHGLDLHTAIWFELNVQYLLAMLPFL